MPLSRTALLLSLTGAAATATACRAFDPTVAWPAALPHELGAVADDLVEVRRSLADRGTTGLLVARHGRIVHEWYQAGDDYNTRFWGASMAKALAGGLSLLLVLQEGRVALDAPAARWIPAWQGDSLRARITLRQLASHTSGLANRLDAACPRDDPPGWSDRFWSGRPNPFVTAITEVPLCATPGSRMVYSSPAFAALGYAVTSALRGTPTPDLPTVLRQGLADPLEIPPSAWTFSYTRSWPHDGVALYATWGGASYTARAAARFGQLIVNHGRWRGQVLLDSSLVDYLITCGGGEHAALAAPGEPVPVLGWWSNCNGAWSSLPHDAVVALGSGQQVLLAVPSLGVVMVRFGSRVAPETDWATPLEQVVFEPVLRAFRH